MKKNTITGMVFFIATIASMSSHVSAFEAVAKKLKAAMNSDIRTEQEISRDKNRLPVETLEFFGLRDDMKVVELIPGGGWYTKLLAPVLAEKGELHVAIGSDFVEQNLLGKPGFKKVNVTAKNAKYHRKEGARLLSLENAAFGVNDRDMVLTFRNYHNFDAEARAAMNRAAFNALKSGGIYGVVDHTRRHMESDNPENIRRIDPVLAIKEIQAAGFELVDYSNLHYRPDDELRYEVGRKTVTGNTDRWVLKFRKK